MKQYKWKAWKKKPEPPQDNSNNGKQDNGGQDSKKDKKRARKKRKTEPTPLEDMIKSELVDEMERQHPLASLNMGTLSSNSKAALADKPSLTSDVVTCIKDAVAHVARTVRLCQRLIGQYLELLFTEDKFEEKDREWLDLICPRVHDGDEEGEDTDETAATEADVQASSQCQFMLMLLGHLYSGDLPARSTKNSLALIAFLGRVHELGLLPRGNEPGTRTAMPYPKSILFQNAASQLCGDLKKHYRNGSKEIKTRINLLKGQGRLPGMQPATIDGNLSAIENFVRLNRMDKKKRGFVPMSFGEQPFVTFSERELVCIFWQNTNLKTELQRIAKPSFPRLGANQNPTRADVADIWLRGQPPGYLIKHFISNVGQVGLTSRKKGKAGYKGKTTLMTAEQMRQHLLSIQQADFDPISYSTRGYALRGSIRTDGFRVQVQSFKLRELKAVKYKRLPDNRLPPRLTSTVGGIDDYLTEVRNVIRSPQDVARLWPDTNPDDIKVLAHDLGQVNVVGAYAYIPDTAPTSAAPPKPAQEKVVHHNLAVKSKAMYQPQFKFRRWMEGQKKIVPPGESSSISDIESGLPALRGEDASVINYVKELSKVEDRLDEFYNGNEMQYKRHKWDAARAKDTEYNQLANSLLKVVGGNIGEQRKDSNKVIIAIGLGQFLGTPGLTSLHSSFMAFFVRKARSLNYIVIGVNEFYSSKKCPSCEQFVGEVEYRRLYCQHCRAYMHRDIMAAENMCNIVRSYLQYQRRPAYLQPTDSKGRLLWSSSGSNNGTGHDAERAVAGGSRI
ncbi:hypothetical protein BGZ68_009834 [Mortierella alpina]|nr:hypothetical protein BGZ68_009834 [Mortierella alpina]